MKSSLTLKGRNFVFCVPGARRARGASPTRLEGHPTVTRATLESDSSACLCLPKKPNLAWTASCKEWSRGGGKWRKTKWRPWTITRLYPTFHTKALETNMKLGKMKSRKPENSQNRLLASFLSAPTSRVIAIFVLLCHSDRYFLWHSNANT